MRRYIFIFIISLSAAWNANAQDCNKAAATGFVHNLFKSGQFHSHDSVRFWGHTNELKMLHTPLLNKLLPGYCFYATSFLSNYYEYLSVQTALAFSKNDHEKTRILHSPVFISESPDYLELFYGLQVMDTAQKILLAKEIVGIFSELTYRGHFKRLVNTNDNQVVSFELWHGDLSWRIYDFYFDSTNRLTRIRIIGGVSRQQMLPGYKRQ